MKSCDAELFKQLFKAKSIFKAFQSQGSRFDFEHFFAKRAEVGRTWVIGDQTWTEVDMSNVHMHAHRHTRMHTLFGYVWYRLLKFGKSVGS